MLSWQTASGPNAFTLCLPVPSKLNIPEWWSHLCTYPDTNLYDFLEFGWPVGYSTAAPTSSTQNHGSALSRLDVIDAFLTRKCELGATCGPFLSDPLSKGLTISPLQIAYSRSRKPRVVSFPHCHSVNTGISPSSATRRWCFVGHYLPQRPPLPFVQDGLQARISPIAHWSMGLPSPWLPPLRHPLLWCRSPVQTSIFHHDVPTYHFCCHVYICIKLLATIVLITLMILAAPSFKKHHLPPFMPSVPFSRV